MQLSIPEPQNASLGVAPESSRGVLIRPTLENLLNPNILEEMAFTDILSDSVKQMDDCGKGMSEDSLDVGMDKSCATDVIMDDVE